MRLPEKKENLRMKSNLGKSCYSTSSELINTCFVWGMKRLKIQTGMDMLRFKSYEKLY